MITEMNGKLITIILLSVSAFLQAQTVYDVDVGDTVYYDGDGPSGVITVDNVVYVASFSLPDGLPTENLLGYWSNSYGINADSTIYLVDENNNPVDTIDLVGLDWDITAGYIPLKTAATMDWVGTPTIDTAFWNHPIPPCVVYPNIDYQGKTFIKIASQSFNSDSTELYPERITDIAVYTSRVTTDSALAWTYFNVPTRVSGCKWIDFNTGNDVTGDGTESNPYKTIATVDALTLTAGTVVYVRSGLSALTNTLNLYKTYNYRGIGYNDLYISSTKYVYKRFYQDYFQGFIFRANTTQTYVILDEKGLNNQYNKFIQNGANGYYSMTHTNTNLVKNNVWTGTLSTVGIYLRTNSAWFIDNNFIAPTAMASFLQNDNSAIGGKVFFRWNKMNTNIIPTAAFFLLSTTDCRYNPVIKYNRITLSNASATQHVFSLSDRDSIWFEKNYIKDNGTATTMPLRIITAGVVIDTMIVRNNFIDHDGPYAISVGSETTSANDNKLNNGLISGNYIYGIINSNSAVVSSAHSIFYGFNKDAKVIYNKIKGSPYGTVIKGSTTAYSTGGFFYNVYFNCDYAITIKGIDSVKVYNNTIIQSLPARSMAGIYVINNGVDDGSRYCKIKNNIIVTDSTNQYAIATTTYSLTGMESDYNVFYCRAGQPHFQIDATVYHTLAEWQVASGQDAHSVVVNPNLDANGIPSIPLTGVNLGVEFDDGLDITTNYSDGTLMPTIVTRQQGATWQIGAYIQE